MEAVLYQNRAHRAKIAASAAGRRDGSVVT
jgi:hypothetical protein